MLIVPPRAAFVFAIFLAGFLGSVSRAQDPEALVGLWWGGLELPDEFETLVLEITAQDGELRVEACRPYDGIGAEVMEVVATAPRLVVERAQSAGVVTLDLRVDGPLLRGEARLGTRSVPAILRRTRSLDAKELDELLGDYRAASGERIRIDRLPVATRHPTLVCSWADSMRARTLVAVGEDEFAFGPDFRRVGPTEGSVSFDRDADGGVVLRWELVDGGGEAAERFPISVDEARIDAFVEAERARFDVPSFSVGIVHGQDLVFARSYGVLNRETQEPATPDSLYQIASVTKVFTATLLMAMRDEGLVALDDPVTKYLPADVELPALDPAGAQAITLRHLVTHTSGLRLQPNNYVFNGRHNDDYTVAGLYACLPETSTLFPVGRSWSYSNLGYVLLGHALARAGAASYEELLRARILGPLGMSNTTITLDPETRARLATHYWQDDPRTPTPPWIPGEIAAQGGVTSSVRDLAKFLSFSFRDERADAGPLSGASLYELQQPWARRGGGDGWIAHGWFRDHDPESGTILSHSGFTGGSSSYVGFSPNLEVGVIVLTNFGFDPAVRVGRFLMEEAVRSARSELVPTSHEARRLADEGDWSNAAWAFGVLSELDPEEEEWARRHERAQARRGN